METVQGSYEKVSLLQSEEDNQPEKCDEPHGLKKSDKAENKRRVLFCIMAVVYHMACFSSVCVPGQLLPVYGLHSPLQFELSTLSALEGGYYGCIAVSNLLFAVVSKYVSQKAVMSAGLVGMAAASVVLVLLGDKTQWGLGAGILVFSFMIGPHFNGAVVLVSEEIGLTTTMSAAFLFAYAVAADGGLFCYSIVLQTFGFWVFLWTPLVCTVITLVCFAPTAWMMRK